MSKAAEIKLMIRVASREGEKKAAEIFGISEGLFCYIISEALAS